MNTQSAHLKNLVIDLLVEPKKLGAGQVAALTPEDWQHVFVMGKQHRIFPALERALAAQPDQIVPKALHGARQKSAMRMLKIGVECVKIHECLVQRDIPHVFLKGVPLAYSIYQEAGLRPIRDIDLLVRPEDTIAAHQALIALGGPIERYSHQDSESVDLNRKHLPPFWSPNRVIPVELHTQVLGNDPRISPTAVRPFEALFWSDQGHFRLGTHMLPGPSPEVMFAHLVVHGVMDHELNNGPLMLTDIIALIKSAELQPGKLHRIIEGLDAGAAADLVMSLLPENLQRDVQIYPRFDANWDPKHANNLLLQDGQRRDELRMSVDLGQENSAGKVRFILRKAFATRETMLNRWMMMHGPAKVPPKNIVAFWIWFITVRIAAMVPLKRSDVTKDALPTQSLIELRQALQVPRTTSTARAKTVQSNR